MKKKRSPSEILVSPLHYVLDSKAQGSEFSWAKNYYLGISGKIDNISFVVGASDVNKNDIKSLNLFKVNKIDLSLRNVIKFNLMVEFYCIYKIIFGNLKVLHHFLPYSIENSLLLSFLLPSRALKIVGPIQQSLTFKDLDIDIRDARSFGDKSKKLNKRSIPFSNILRKYISIFSLYCLKKSDVIICTSEEVKRNLVRKGISQIKLVVIPPVFIPQTRVYNSFNRCNLESIKFVTACMLLKRKQVDLIINAFLDANKLNNHSLTIIGEGPEKSYLQDIIDSTKKSRITFLGHIDNEEIISVLNNFDVLVCASKSESFSALAIESLFANNSFISTNVGGFREIIEACKNGILINDDIQSFTNAFRDFMDGTYDINEFKNNALTNKSRFDSQSIFNQYKNIYNF